MSTKKNTTIMDVAKHANVSKSTVSNFLNGHYHNMSEQTRAKLEAVVLELNYRPNRQAQSLKSKKSYLIGMVVADISNIYSSRLLKGMGDILEQSGYQVIIVDAANSPVREKKLLKKLIDQSVEAIVLQPIQQESDHYNFIAEQHVPLFLVDRQTTPQRWPLVTTDNTESTELFAQEFIKQNYDEVWYVTEPIGTVSTRELRYQGLKKTLETSHVKLHTLECEHFDDALVKKIKELANKQTKVALFAANGRVLSKILHITILNKIKIPQQLGISGYDDWDWTSIVGPGISCIEQHPFEIGLKMGEVILANLAGEKISAEYIIPATIQLRHSL